VSVGNRATNPKKEPFQKSLLVFEKGDERTTLVAQILHDKENKGKPIPIFDKKPGFDGVMHINTGFGRPLFAFQYENGKLTGKAVPLMVTKLPKGNVTASGCWWQPTDWWQLYNGALGFRLSSTYTYVCYTEHGPSDYYIPWNDFWCEGYCSGSGDGTISPSGLPEGTGLNYEVQKPQQHKIISNLESYLSCFDRNQPAKISIYVDQPVANSTEVIALSPDVGLTTGHTFVTITQGTITRSIGFYPNDMVKPGNASAIGVLVNDQEHEFDVAISFYVPPNLLSKILNHTSNFPNSYNLNTNKRTDFAMDVAAIAGYPLSGAYSTWPGGGGNNPAQLGQTIRSVPPRPGETIQTTTGVAPVNSGNCQQ
jgi:hypothetical protein